MIWIGGGILYLVLIVTIGVMCIRKGHWVMFIVGLFLPVLLADRRDHAAGAAVAPHTVHRLR